MRYIISLIIFLTITSCGVFKKTNKTIDYSNGVEVVKRDCVVTGVVESKEFDKGRIDSEVMTVTEKKKAGERVKIRGKVEHGTNVLSDSLGREFIAVFDSLSKVVEVTVNLPDEVEVQTVREKRSEKKDTERTEVKKETANIRDEKKISNEVKNTVTESKPDYSWILYVAFAAVVIFILLKRKLI